MSKQVAENETVKITGEISRFMKDKERRIKKIKAFEAEMKAKVKEVMDKIEKNRIEETVVGTSKEPEIVFLTGNDEISTDISSSKFMIAKSVALYAKDKEDPGIFSLFQWNDPDTGFGSSNMPIEEGEKWEEPENAISKAGKEFYDNFGLLAPNKVASYNVRINKLKIRGLPAEMFPSTHNKKFPYILTSLHNELSRKMSNNYFEALIAHELTHAYIKNEVGRTRERTHAVEEAAAQVTTMAMGEEIDESTFYEEKHGMSRHQFHTAQHYFQQFISNDEAVSINKIRKEAVEAIERLREHPDQDLSSVLNLENEVEHLETIQKAVSGFETVEHLVFNQLVRLDIITGEDDWRNYMENIEKSLENEVLRDKKKLLPRKMNDEHLSFNAKREIRQNLISKKRVHHAVHQISKGKDDILEILKNEDLTYEERKQLQELNGYVKKLVNDYKEEKFVKKSLEALEMDYHETRDKIQNVRNPDKTNVEQLHTSETLLKKQLNTYIHDYQKVISLAIQLNEKILTTTTKLHSEEENIKPVLRKHLTNSKYQELETMLDLTSEMHQICLEAQSKLEESEEYLEKLEQILDLE